MESTKQKGKREAILYYFETNEQTKKKYVVTKHVGMTSWFKTSIQDDITDIKPHDRQFICVVLEWK
jgi:hypothetical protein